MSFLDNCGVHLLFSKLDNDSFAHTNIVLKVLRNSVGQCSWNSKRDDNVNKEGVHSSKILRPNSN